MPETTEFSPCGSSAKEGWRGQAGSRGRVRLGSPGLRPAQKPPGACSGRLLSLGLLAVTGRFREPLASGYSQLLPGR